MATASENDIASTFLKTLGAPDSEIMRRAVIAWLRKESGRRIIGNNPWNISLPAAQEIARKGGPAPIGYRTHSVTGQKFAVYDTVNNGSIASARLLLGAGNDWRGYHKVIAAARANDPIAFLNALAASAWDAGRYGTRNGGVNQLLSVYRSVGGAVNVSLTTAANTVTTATNTLADRAIDLLKQAGFTDTSPSHVITESEAKAIAEKLYKVDPNGMVGQRIVSEWTGKTVAEWTGRSVTEGDSLAPTDTLRAFGDIATALTDPRRWLLILALLAGGGMVAFGGINVLRAA